MSKERNHGLLGFIAGAAIGATLGLLFAPRSGKETRERWTGKAKDAKDDLEDYIDLARAEWAKAKGRAADTATMTKDEVSDFVRFLFEEAEDLKERVGKDVRDSADEVAQRARNAADHIRQGTKA
jgi:gas vesicle protein